MGRPINPFNQATICYEVMEMALQGEFDGLPGTDDLTAQQIAEVLGVQKISVVNAIGDIKRRGGYCVPYVKLKGGRRLEK